MKWTSAGQIALGLAVGFHRERTAELTIWLCEQHARLYTRGTLLMWLGLGLLAVSVGIVVKTQVGSALALFGIIGGIGLFLYGAICRWWTAQRIYAVRMDETGIWLGGVPRDLREALPPL